LRVSYRVEISLELVISFTLPVIVDQKVVKFTTFPSTITGTIDDITSFKLISTLYDTLN